MNAVVAVGMLHQETNTFNRRSTRLEDLDVREGQEVIDHWRGSGMGLAAGIDLLESAGYETRGMVAATGASGGALVSSACERLIDSMVENAKVIKPDAVFLDLHGALVGETMPDVTGSLLCRLVEALGPEVPIAAGLDCHASLTQDIVNNLDVMVGFKTWPHVDYDLTGAHAADLFVRTLNGEIQPKLRVVKMPMIQGPENADFSNGPMASLVSDLGGRQTAGEILDGTLYPTQAWLDIPDHGSAVTVTTDGDANAAERIAHEVAETWWNKRREFMPTLHHPNDAVRAALDLSANTVMISESADSINSGSTGDNPKLIEALVENAGESMALTFTCDANLVEQVADCALNDQLEVTFGANCDRRFTEPYRARVTVEKRVPGKFQLEGKYFNGLKQDLGGAVVLRIKNIHILVGCRPVMCSEPNLYRCADLEPGNYKIVGIKSPGSFRPNFASISTTVLHLDMAGAATPHLPSLPWQNVGRPLFPLDDDAAYRPVLIQGRRG